MGGGAVQYLGGGNVGSRILNNQIHNFWHGVYVKHCNGDTATSDTTAPTLLSAGTLDKKTIGLKFSEALNSATASAIGNYAG